MSAIKSLCTRCILLIDGAVAFDGDVSEAIDKYLMQESNMAQTGIIPEDLTRQFSTDEARFKKVILSNGDNTQNNQFYFRQEIKTILELEVSKNISDVFISLMIGTTDGTLILYLDSLEQTVQPISFAKGFHKITVNIPGVLLPGNYSVYIGLSHITGTTIDWVERVYDFTVLKTAVGKDQHYKWVSSHGFVNQKSDWTFSKLN
jgi:lipopolysaccharide transport system ATP-binding protein